MTARTEPAAFTAAEAAAYVSVSVPTLKAAIHSAGGPGALPPLAAKKVGARYLITREALDNWVDALEDA